jgi:hypothetical protein
MGTVLFYSYSSGWVEVSDFTAWDCSGGKVDIAGGRPITGSSGVYQHQANYSYGQAGSTGSVYEDQFAPILAAPVPDIFSFLTCYSCTGCHGMLLRGEKKDVLVELSAFVDCSSSRMAWFVNCAKSMHVRRCLFVRHTGRPLFYCPGNEPFYMWMCHYGTAILTVLRIAACDRLHHRRQRDDWLL